MKWERPASAVRRSLLPAVALAAMVVVLPDAGTGAHQRAPASPTRAESRTGRVEVLRAVGGIPPHIVGEFRQPVGFAQARSGQYFVLDRRAHTVYGIDLAKTGAWRILQVGQEPGRLLDPTAFDLDPLLATFVVADAPEGHERIQVFGSGGALIGGFRLPHRPSPRLTLGSIVLSGVGSVHYDGHRILLSLPATGALFSEYTRTGDLVRSFGTLRATGQEADPDVHLALNAGLPLADPDGGFVFVFQTGVPMFRKYDKAGTLLFERHIEGPELDALVGALPSRWPKRRTDGGGELPLVPPTVQAAAIDPAGHLWISLTVPFTYVYRADGEKSRVVQFRGAGIIAPASFSFTDAGGLLVTPGCYEFEPWPARPTTVVR